MRSSSLVTLIFLLANAPACGCAGPDALPIVATASLTITVPSSYGTRDAGAFCPDFSNTVFRETPEPKASYSVDGYLARTMWFSRLEHQDLHCVVVLWPSGTENSEGKRSGVARHLDEAWFTALDNTLRRIPWPHVKTLHRIVIDNQPQLHGLAAFDRDDPNDGRDGHTIWLNEHLFRDDDHWVRANVGSYFSYHTNEPGEKFDGQAPDHALFSPVLLHEIGHIVMYDLVNPTGEEAATPECARSCGDLDDGCEELPALEQETNCISPYCRPHRYPGSTENWAEQYRFFYQTSQTRALLSKSGGSCVGVLSELDTWPQAAEGWPFGLPDDGGFKPSRWDSCRGRACKAW